jgi:hypothetical protein
LHRILVTQRESGDQIVADPKDRINRRCRPHPPDWTFLPLRKLLVDQPSHGRLVHLKLVLVHRHDGIVPARLSGCRPRFVPAEHGWQLQDAVTERIAA